MLRPRPVEAKMTTLKLRLLREDERFTVDSSLKEGHQLLPVAWRGIEGAQLYVGRVYCNPPSWLEFLRGGIEALPNQDLQNTGSAAILFIPVDGRTMAICFGHAHMVMNLHSFERNFGLRVTLNKVQRDRLRSIDSATPDSVTFQRRIQASRDSDLSHFGIDYDSDLVTLAAGTPTDETFAKFLAGKDSLSITCALTPLAILGKCRQALEAYSATDYRTDYKWIDHIQPVRETDIITRLDGELFAALQELMNGVENDLHLAPPEIVDYTDGSELRYNGLGQRGDIFNSLAIEDYVLELQRSNFAGGIDEIKQNHLVSAKNDDATMFSEKWKVYNCFVHEAELDNMKYVLFSGEWFKIDNDFAAEVEGFFNAIERRDPIPATDCVNEKALIDHLEASRTDFVKLDCVKINPGGTRYANLEPCDFFSENKEFIHIKDGHSSGSISHLWMQGVVSAEAFVADLAFRKKLRKEVKRRNEDFTRYLPTRSARPTPSDYTVVYAVMRKPYRTGDLGLPFFSKVSLRTAIHRLETFGYNVAINLIEKRCAGTIAEEEEGEV